MASYVAGLHFCVYDDVAGTPNGSLSGEVWLDQDPLDGSYDPFSDYGLRGSVTETIGWRVIQVMPYVEGGVTKSSYRRRIVVADENTMTRPTVVALQAKSISLGTIYRFYDGENIFRVWFSVEPPGFVARRSERPWREGRLLTNPPAAGFLYYSYQITLEAFEVITTVEGLT